MPTAKELGLVRGTKEYSSFMQKRKYRRYKDKIRAYHKERYANGPGKIVAEKRAALPPLLRSKGNKPRKGVVKICRHCGKEFYVNPCRTYRVFCCMEHSIQWDKDHAFRFSCVVCNKTVFTQPTQIKYRERKTCSRDCAGKLKAMRAEQDRLVNPPSEGVLRRRIRYSKRMDEWRKAVFARDNYTCQICGDRSRVGHGVTLNADHIKPFAFYPELRFDLDNGRTLCLECHRKTESWGRPKKGASPQLGL